ncbi:hypothetical protein HK102_000955, partial [Quaeritorhiza haematococci]
MPKKNKFYHKKQNRQHQQQNSSSSSDAPDVATTNFHSLKKAIWAEEAGKTLRLMANLISSGFPQFGLDKIIDPLFVHLRNKPEALEFVLNMLETMHASPKDGTVLLKDDPDTLEISMPLARRILRGLFLVSRRLQSRAERPQLIGDSNDTPSSTSSSSSALKRSISTSSEDEDRSKRHASDSFNTQTAATDNHQHEADPPAILTRINRVLVTDDLYDRYLMLLRSEAHTPLFCNLCEIFGVNLVQQGHKSLYKSLVDRLFKIGSAADCVSLANSFGFTKDVTFHDILGKLLESDDVQSVTSLATDKDLETKVVTSLEDLCEGCLQQIQTAFSTKDLGALRTEETKLLKFAKLGGRLAEKFSIQVKSFPALAIGCRLHKVRFLIAHINHADASKIDPTISLGDTPSDEWILTNYVGIVELLETLFRRLQGAPWGDVVMRLGLAELHRHLFTRPVAGHLSRVFGLDEFYVSLMDMETETAVPMEDVEAEIEAEVDPLLNDDPEVPDEEPSDQNTTAPVLPLPTYRIGNLEIHFISKVSELNELAEMLGIDTSTPGNDGEEDAPSGKNAGGIFQNPSWVAAMDSEWSPDICALPGENSTNAAIIQLAIERIGIENGAQETESDAGVGSREVFILDLVNLDLEAMTTFLSSLFKNSSILKLGFEFKSDFGKLRKRYMNLPQDLLGFQQKQTGQQKWQVASTSGFLDLSALRHQVKKKDFAVHPNCLAVSQGDGRMENNNNNDNSDNSNGTGGEPKDKIAQQIKLALQKKKPSLSDFVAWYLGSRLVKTERLSNWERRPLRPEQLHYA